MLAVLSATTFDPLGVVALDVFPETVRPPVRRRTNRIATLDGSAVFNDFGYSEADKTIALRWHVSYRATEESVDRLTRLYSRVRVAVDGAVYLAAIETYTPGATESEIVLLVVEKLNT